jgi:hypothetical protein
MSSIVTLPEIRAALFPVSPRKYPAVLSAEFLVQLPVSNMDGRRLQWAKAHPRLRGVANRAALFGQSGEAASNANLVMATYVPTPDHANKP